jgi:hypothetical protein
MSGWHFDLGMIAHMCLGAQMGCLRFGFSMLVGKGLQLLCLNSCVAGNAVPIGELVILEFGQH